MSFLEMKNVTVGYDRKTNVLENFSIRVEKGEFVSLLGASGSGKTTTLRTIAGFLPIKSGELLIRGKLYNKIPPNRRNIGIVFQNYALFPHLNAFENVAFGLKLRKMSKDEIERKVRRALELVGLSGFENRLPSQLSGGQQQRVAIARAIVIEPDLLLMDEPLSNLDAKLRIEMRSELRRLQKELGITTIYVTHDQAEAIALSDKIALLNDGKIEHFGTPEEIYNDPKTLYAAKFMGFQEFLKGKIVGFEEGYTVISYDGGKFMARESENLKIGDDVVLLARKKSFKILKEKVKNTFLGRIIARIFQGDTVLYIVNNGYVESLNVELELSMDLWKEGDEVIVGVEPDDCIAFKT